MSPKIQVNLDQLNGEFHGIPAGEEAYHTPEGVFSHKKLGVDK